MSHKIYLLLLAVCFTGTSMFAQQHRHSNGMSCGSDHLNNQYFQNNPEVFQKRNTFDREVSRLKKNGMVFSAMNLNNQETYEIPIVVHIVHSGEQIGTLNNPSDQQIIDWVTYTNDVLAGTANGMLGEGNGGAKIPVKLVLAKRTPSCEPTTGILRVNASDVPGYTQHGIDYNNQLGLANNNTGASHQSIRDLSRWDGDSYYNIYVVKDITEGYAGFAYLPGADSAIDGSFMETSTVGTSDTSFAHEIGHALGLLHTFQGGDFETETCPPTETDCTLEGDKVCDTEIIKSLLSYSYANYPDNDTINPCTGVNYQGTQYNIMHYGAILNRFTPGQRDRAILQLLEYRGNLLSSLGGQEPEETSNIVLTEMCIPGPAQYSGNNMGPVKVAFGDILVVSEASETSDSSYFDYSNSCLVKGSTSIPGYEPTVLSVSTAQYSFSMQHVKVYIDWNNNGNFEEATETVMDVSTFYPGSNFGPGTFTANVTPPPYAVKGTALRMRVIGDVAPSPCYTPSYGQVEDYAVTVIESINGCEGISEQITAEISQETAYSGGEIYLSASGVLGSIGIEYQWQKSLDGINNWTDIANANTLFSIINVEGAISDKHYYRLKITCTESQAEYISSVVFYEIVPEYCSAGGVNNFSAKINNVVFVDIDNNSTGLDYEDFTNLVSQVMIGETYSLTVSSTSSQASSASSNYEVLVWIDFNYDGDFNDEGELVLQTLGASPWTGNITIPANVSLGERRMRIRLHSYNNSPNATPCGNSGTGQVEDYTINITDLNCEGISDNIIASIVSGSFEQNSQLTLTAEGVQGVQGINYQWQKSINNTTDWQDIANANTRTSTITIQESAGNTVYYRLKVTCIETQVTSYSQEIPVIIQYCVPVINSVHETITNISVADINYNNTLSTSYINNSQIAGNLTAGETYIFTATGSENYSDDRISVWVDFNLNGSFDDEGELLFTTAGASLWTSNITIPGDISSGVVPMRVRLTYGQNVTSCQSSYNGQTIDLMVNLHEIEGCSGISDDIIASISNLNENQITLTAQGALGNSQNISYQWQQNIQGTPTWEDIENANSLTSSVAITGSIGQTINYRLKVTCLETQQEHFSSVVSHEIFPEYCVAGATSTQFHKINNVTFADINNNSTSTSGYEDFTHIVTDVQVGNTYAFSASYTESTFYYDELFVWIDFNYDGDFDDEGELVLQTSGASPWIGNITIPENASLGERRMRIRMHYNQPGSDYYIPNSTPCGNSTIGQVEDYTVNIFDIGCSGISSNIIASISNTTENQITLTAQGVEGTSMNVSYQWQKNITGTSDWEDIQNATTLSSNVAVVGEIGQTTIYRLKVICIETLATYYSSTVSHEIVFYYCSAGADHATYESISNVTFADINNNSSDAQGYEDFTSIIGTVTRGITYSTSITGPSYPSDQLLIWIDFNNNGSFNDEGELVLHTSGSSPWAGSITIPENTSLGERRMRIRLHDAYSGANATPCGNSTYGQVEDYTLNIIDLGCSGISDNIIASISDTNENQITLNAQGVEGTPQNISYQWQQNIEGTSIWENIPNATSLNSVVTLLGEPGQTINSRLQVTCLETQENYYSTTVSHQIAMSYCAAGSEYEANVSITNVTFAGINNSSSSSQGYENFTSIVGNVVRGENYPFSVSVNSNVYRQVLVWIDYNNNGLFTDEGEQVLQLDSIPWSTNITVPSNATLGQTRMRIRIQYTDEVTLNNTPCGNSVLGQVEDYTINITDLGCSGISDNIIASMSSPIENQVTLSAQGVEGTPQYISYQWQQNLQGTAIWENIPNATTLSSNVTLLGEPAQTINYRLQVTCLETQEHYYSTTVSYQFPLIYCSAGAVDASWVFISNVTFADINNTSDIYDGYEDYTSITGTVQQGETYLFSVAGGESWDADHKILVWIDYNNNGLFEEGEQVINSDLVSSPWSGNITIPANTPIGNKRMRIRIYYDYLGNTTPCENAEYGQVEDYTITILPNPNPVNNCNEITTWNGTSWSNGYPDVTKKAIIDGDLELNNNLSTCELEVTENGKLTIPANITLTVKGQVVNNATAADFVVANDGMLIQIDDVENQGAITVLRNSNPMKRLDYTLWSSPVENMMLKNFSQVSPNGGTGTLWNRVYTLGQNAWEQVWNSYNEVETGSETFDIAKGYLYRAKNSYHSTNTVIFEGEFTGTPNNGSISISTPLSFNGIGNPYPSAIDVDELMIANSGVNALYFWTNVNAPVGGNYVLNNWASYTIMGGAGVASNGNGEQEYEPKGIIMPGQGFVIQTSGAHVLFNNSMRTSENEGFFRQMNNDRHRFWLNLSDDVVSYNQILVGYMENATQAVDTGIDAQMYAYEGNAIYSLIENDNKPFVIQGRSLPFLDTDIVKIGFRAVNEGNFTIALNNFDGLFDEGYTTIYLKDNFNGNLHNLNSGAYSFLSETGVFDNRFEIVYQTTMDVENSELNDTDWIVYKQDKHFQVQTKGFELKEVWVYDLLGRILYKANAENNTHTIPTLDVDGVFIVKVVTTQDKILNKKVK